MKRVSGAENLPKRATVSKLETVLRGIGMPLSQTAIRGHIKKAGLKQAERDKTYSTAAVLRAIEKHQKTDIRHKGGALGDELKRLQIKKIELEIGGLEGSIIPIDEHNQELRELFGHVDATLNNFLSGVGVLTKDPKVTELAEKLCSNTREFWLHRMEELI